MEKNQAVVAMVAVVFVVVGIFLYFVFRSDQQDIAQQGQEEQSEFTAKVGEDVLEQIALEQERKTIEAISSETQQEIKNDVVAQQSDDVNMQDKTIVSSAPQTGPGTIAVVVSTVAGLFVGMFVYMKTTKGNALV